ncbi:MAG: substrate-binding domain-containing protein [Methylomonas sp.]
MSFAMTAHAVEIAKPAEPVAGRLSVTGSVALSNLLTYWTQAFADRNPLIYVTIADPGGNAGIDALINNTADLALTSASLNDEQSEAFSTRFGYPPHVIPVAMDAVAVYANDANPLTSIAIPDLDAVFSSTYRCGEPQPIRTWGALGVIGILERQRITVYGLTVDTGANSLFRETALCGGDFIKDFQALAGPDAVESALISDFAGIGFSSSAMSAPGIHALAIAPRKGEPAVTPSPDAIRSGRYAMSRTLAITVNQPENRPLLPALQAFIEFVLSPDGQRIAAKAGYVTLH